MTITICISDLDSRNELFTAPTLADAARMAVEAREGEIQAEWVTPPGGTHYHTVNRDVDPEGFWAAQLSHSMSDNERWGWGDTAAAAIANAHPPVDGGEE